MNAQQFFKTKKNIQLGEQKNHKPNPLYKPNFSLRKSLFKTALSRTTGGFFFITHATRGKDDNLMERNTASISLCKASDKDLLINVYKKKLQGTVAVDFYKTGYLDEKEINALFPAGLHMFCFGLDKDTITRFEQMASGNFMPSTKEGKPTPNGNGHTYTTDGYLPSKSDFEEAVQIIKSRKSEATADETLDIMEVIAKKTGHILATAWRTITENKIFNNWTNQKNK